MIRQFAQAGFDRDLNCWMIGYYESPGPAGPVAQQSMRSQEAAEQAAAEYNAQQKQQ